MIPLSDGIPALRFPWMNVALILGGWFLFELIEGDFGLLSASSGGVAFFAHVGGFLFGVCAARLLSIQPTPSPKEVLA